jgi:hypothetical protein
MDKATPARIVGGLEPMFKRNTSEEDSAVAVAELPPAPIPWKVMSVEALPDFQLHVSFADGTTGRVEMREMIFGARAGVFAELADTDAFQKVFVERYAVTWPNELDLAPDAMYDEIKLHGVWILR